MVPVMSSDPTSDPDDARAPVTAAGSTPGDAAHLDEDPEALEDPVHSGDAQHQHDLHARTHSPPEESGQRD